MSSLVKNDTKNESTDDEYDAGYDIINKNNIENELNDGLVGNANNEDLTSQLNNLNMNESGNLNSKIYLKKIEELMGEINLLKGKLKW